MTGPVALPGWFLRFIGVAEVLGALGLVLPGLLRIRPGLTAVAAAGLVIIMMGATIVMWVGGVVAVVLMNVVVALLAGSSPTAAGGWRRIATRPAGRYSGPPAKHKASRKEQTIGAGGCSKARLGRAFG